MDNSIFRFKKFSVKHGKSSMKIGVDSVLLGAWVEGNFKNILDLGTGCGVISLILAQRFPNARITGVDIDIESIKEAGDNFLNWEFGNKPVALKKEFPTDFNGEKAQYDLIVSNPPYFQSGINHPTTNRERARHQDLLTPFSMIRSGLPLLKEGGKIAMIFPTEFIERIKNYSSENGVELTRICYVRNNEKRPEKRTLIELMHRAYATENIVEERLTLFNHGEPTVKYKALCKDFYLNF